jgi:galactokinase
MAARDSIRRTERALVEQFGEADRPISLVSAPGRVNLIGGHTDYNEGVVLPMAIDHRAFLAARPRDDDEIRVHSLNFEETVSFPLGAIEPSPETRWANYVKGVAAKLRERGHDVGGADVVVDGQVPMGAGLSSSAALEVAVGEGLAATSDLDLGDDLVTACWEAENDFVGVGCGIMDQYTSVHGQVDSALFLDCRTESHEIIPVDGDDVTVIATNTNVQHELVDSAYNDRVDSCARGVEILDDHLDGEVTALADVSVDDFEAHAEELPETVRKRVRHVVTENDRVRDAADALREGDLDRVGDLLDQSHASLRDDYEVSCDELDAVADIGADHEAVFGSRMTGAGFGGCVISLVRPDAVDDVTALIEHEYEERTNIEPDSYVCNPDGGVRRHDTR